MGKTPSGKTTRKFIARHEIEKVFVINSSIFYVKYMSGASVSLTDDDLTAVSSSVSQTLHCARDHPHRALSSV